MHVVWRGCSRHAQKPDVTAGPRPKAMDKSAWSLMELCKRLALYFAVHPRSIGKAIPVIAEASSEQR